MHIMNFVHATPARARKANLCAGCIPTAFPSRREAPKRAPVERTPARGEDDQVTSDDTALSGDMLARLIAPVSAAALAAGEAILAVYRTDFDAERKDDGSPVTLADTAAEAVILPALAAVTPAIPIVSEEQVSAGEGPDRVGRRYWLVDPLDGTREFLKRNDEFTVNIGLVEDGTPVFGVLYAPALGLLYAAAGPGTATLSKSGGPARPIACREVPASGLDVLVSRSHSRNDKLEAWLEANRGAHEVHERIPAGSALKFGRLAEGAGDVYPRLGPTCEWDTAAGHAILLAAGGRVETLEGEPFTYGRARTDFLNPSFVAWGRR